jgi:hypothetical protein
MECKPLDFSELTDWSPPDPDLYKTIELHKRTYTPKEQVLLCHDFMNGYKEDRFINGCQTSKTLYSFQYWQYIDIFVCIRCCFYIRFQPSFGYDSTSPMD